MRGEDLSAHLRWDSIPKKNLFAVCPLGRIEGEITILDGKIFTAKVNTKGAIAIDTNWNVQSPFAVYAYVAQWQKFTAETAIHTESELQNVIDKLAAENGYDIAKSFPFRIIAEFDSVGFHIISKPKNETKHSHQLHEKAKKHFSFRKISGELLGFYSQHHEGVFTHKGQFIHTHFIDTKRKNMGHLENVLLTKKYTILLPGIESE